MTALRRLTLGVALSWAGVGLPVAAQDGIGGGPAPPRDPAQQTGTALVTGVVIDESSGHPLRRADVTLTGGGRPLADHAITDDRGLFVFPWLPFGQFTLNVQKRGYLSTYYGSTRPGRAPNRPAITLSPAAPSADLALKVVRGAVITGVVTDPNGRPAPNVRIALLEYRMNAGERQLVTAPTSGPSMTDDRGAYRMFGLLPGDYLLGAVPMAIDPLPISAADVLWAQQQIKQSRVAVSGGSGTTTPAPRPPAKPQPVQYARMFYPGTADPAGALPVTVRPGEERTGVDFTLQYVPSARVEGIVVGLDGKIVARPQFNVTQPGIPGSPQIGVNWNDGPGGARFTINALPPGQYRVSARTSPMPPPSPVGPSAPSAGPPSLWGTTDLAITGTDISDVTIALRPTLTMSGRMSFDASSAKPPQNLSGIRVTLAPVPNGEFPGPPATGMVAADGTFTLSGILPGRHRLSVTGPMLARIGGPPANWLLTSAIVNGQDISDRPFEIQPDQSIQNVVLTWSDQPAEISGKLLDPSGHPATDYTVVLFTTDRLFWGLQSRRTLRFPPGPEGQFRFQGLLPGEYYISAVTDVGPDDFTDPAFFEQLVGASLKIRVDTGEKKTQDLRMAGGRS